MQGILTVDDITSKVSQNAKKIVVRSGHDIHFEKPKYFLRAINYLEKIM